MDVRLVLPPPRLQLRGPGRSNAKTGEETAEKRKGGGWGEGTRGGGRGWKHLPGHLCGARTDAQNAITLESVTNTIVRDEVLHPVSGALSWLFRCGACDAGTDLGFDPFRFSDWLDQDWAAKGELKSTLRPTQAAERSRSAPHRGRLSRQTCCQEDVAGGWSGLGAGQANHDQNPR